MKEYNSIIVGGGIVGAACAFELKKLGQRVLVLDSSSVGTGATGACMGHVVVMDDSPSMLEFTTYSRQLWQDLAAELPENCEDFKPGTLWVAEDESEMLEAFKKKEEFAGAGVESEVVDADALYRHEPNLKKGLAGGLRVADDRVVYPANCVRFMLENIEVKVNSEVYSITRSEVLLTDGRKFYGDNIIVAAGIASAKLLNLPVIPKKGHLVITERYPGFVNHQLIELGYIKKAHSNNSASTAFNIQPRKTGQMIIGSSREYAGMDKSINSKILSQMLSRAKYFIPALAGVKCLRVWTGFRPAAPDGIPYIGRVSEGLYVCTGHEGLGITTSLGSAKIIAAQITGSKSPLDESVYSPARMDSGVMLNEH